MIMRLDAFGLILAGAGVSIEWEVAVTGIANAVQVDVGGDPTSSGGYTCAVLDDGVIKCWGGAGTQGQLGSQTTNTSVPVPINGIADAVAVATAQGGHNCALIRGGSIKCWGMGAHGELGNGVMTHSTVPVTVIGF